MQAAVRLKQRLRGRLKSVRDKAVKKKGDVHPVESFKDLTRPPGRNPSDIPRPPGRRRVEGAPVGGQRGQGEGRFEICNGERRGQGKVAGKGQYNESQGEVTVERGQMVEAEGHDPRDDFLRCQRRKDKSQKEKGRSFKIPYGEADLEPEMTSLQQKREVQQNEDVTKPVKKTSRKYLKKGEKVNKIEERTDYISDNRRKNFYLRMKRERRSDWQSGSTRYEVNARLGNIETTLRDIAITTQNHVYTRLRKIENCLKDITGQRDRRGHRRVLRDDTTEQRDKRVHRKRVMEEKARVNNHLQPEPEIRAIRHSDKPRFLMSTLSSRMKKNEVPIRKTYFRQVKPPKHEVESRRPKIVKLKMKKLQEPKREKPKRKRQTKVSPERSDEGIERDYVEDDINTLISNENETSRKLRDFHFRIFEDTEINLNVPPKLKTSVDTTLTGDVCSPDLRGIVALEVKGTLTIVVTDWANRNIKAFYTKGGQGCFSEVKLQEGPWGLKKLKKNIIGVTIPKSQQIAIYRVNPDLSLLSTIQTGKNYWGLAVMSSSTLIAGSNRPACLDEIDMEGNILQTFDNFKSLENPDCLQMTKNGNILISDSGTKSVLCMTSFGDVIYTVTSAGDRVLDYPSGFVSLTSGDVLLADSAANEIIQFQEVGRYVRKIVSKTADLEKPFGLYVLGKDLYIATRCKEVKVLSF